MPAPIAMEEEKLPDESEYSISAPMDGVEMDTTHFPASVHTLLDGNDLFQQYQGAFPIYNPENSTVLKHLCDGPTFQRSENSDGQLATPRVSYFAPFLNATVWCLMGWFYNSLTQKSLDDLNYLVNDIILADDFNCKDLRNFSAQQETCRLDEVPHNPSSLLFASNGWCTTSIPI